MNIEDRIAAFEKLGKHLSAIDPNEFQSLCENARNENSWFTPESIKTAFSGIIRFLDKKSLSEWVAAYPLINIPTKIIALVMAGNVPLVGFHDFLSILISGNIVLGKLSSKDSFLPTYVADVLVEIEPRFKERIRFEDQLKNFDAVIATGSDNSARYFHYYFGKYPNIIRKNRTSIAILNGQETSEQLQDLGKDVFTYFGLGCRNVSKLYIPTGYDLSRVFESWESFRAVSDHHKYNNNYDYQKSLLLLNQVDFLDNGFVMLQQTDKLVSPISVVYYERYHDEGDLALKITNSKDKIQCIVGLTKPATVAFGQAQAPALTDYADCIDTLRFLTSIS